MRSMRDIVRLPVFCITTGERLGWVKDIVFDEKSSKVTGFVVEKDALIKPHVKKITRDDVVDIAKYALFVEKMKNHKLSGTYWTKKVGSKVFSETGEIRGTVGDIFVDTRVRDIVGYEISDGLFADLFNGRNAILEKDILAESQDVIVIEGGSST